MRILHPATLLVAGTSPIRQAVDFSGCRVSTVHFGGWPSLLKFPIDKHVRLDGTTPVRQRRKKVFSFLGGRLFAFLEGPEVARFLRSMSKGPIRHRGRDPLNFKICE